MSLFSYRIPEPVSFPFHAEREKTSNVPCFVLWLLLRTGFYCAGFLLWAGQCFHPANSTAVIVPLKTSPVQHALSLHSSCTSFCGQSKVIRKTTINLMQRESVLKILHNNTMHIFFNGLEKNRPKMSCDTSYSPVFCTRGFRVAVGFVKPLALSEIVLKYSPVRGELLLPPSHGLEIFFKIVSICLLQLISVSHHTNYFLSVYDTILYRLLYGFPAVTLI